MEQLVRVNADGTAVTTIDPMMAERLVKLREDDTAPQGLSQIQIKSAGFAPQRPVELCVVCGDKASGESY